MPAARNFKKKKIKPHFPRPVESSVDSDSYFSFIAGYTSGEAPFGLTWEEYNPNLEMI